jgi:large subunit ribosomal protein L3
MKGRRMAGRMGNEQVTVKNLEIVEVRDNGILAVKGAIPGARNSVVEIMTA